MPYIKYLDRALTLLPEKFHYAGHCQRGVQYVFPSSEDHDPVKHFPTGKHLFFYEFKSASTKRSVMSNDQFCGQDPTKPRSIFDIEAIAACSISAFSEYGTAEAEVLFRPLAKFCVVHASKKCDPTRAYDSSGGFPDTVALRQLAGLPLGDAPPPEYQERMAAVKALVAAAAASGDYSRSWCSWPRS